MCAGANVLQAIGDQREPYLSHGHSIDDQPRQPERQLDNNRAAPGQRERLDAAHGIGDESVEIDLGNVWPRRGRG